ncbi:MAG: cobalamin-dependent protein [Nitrospinae bacterium]|nr:cobalamin-dependent protein [Nitrospinota bacterium]
MLHEIIRRYNEAVYDTDRPRAMKVIDEAVAAGVTPEEVVFSVVIPGLEGMIDSISKKFTHNLAQHFMAAQIAAAVTDAMVARFAVPPASEGRVVIGNAHGDIHSLGKRIVIGCLRALMIDVVDLGVNVAPEDFVDAAVKQEAGVIAISSLMVHTARGPKGPVGVRQLLRAMDLEGRIKIVVGGAAYRFNENLYTIVEADAWAPDGISAGRVILDLLRERKP